jgi:hypothetical protein
LLVHIGDPFSNQATTLESQMIHMIQELFGRTLTTSSAALGTTLTISGGRFKVVVEGLSDATKGSE